ncbi:MAG TPA: hypothetical protein VIM11_17885 [Tepidisphaeraceae bacterium]
MNRREFLQQAGLAARCVAGGAVVAGCADRPAGEGGELKDGVKFKSVAIVSDPADAVASAPAAQWAVRQLRNALAARNVPVGTAHRLEDVPEGSICLIVAGKSNAMAGKLAGAAGVTLPESADSLAVVPGSDGGRKLLLVYGADARGLGYALTDLADGVARGELALAALNGTHPVIEQPANVVRGIGRLFCSDVEDKPWYNDRGFWTRYLDMLATQRFNRFHLALGLGYDTSNRIKDSYFYFPYPFLLTVPGYEVRAKGLPDAERDNNLVMMRFIGDECAARGIDFQLGLWGHQYVFADSPDVNYPIEGLSSDNHASYCRDALAALLKACPNVSGLTFRIHGESGIAEGSYDFWKTVFEGVVQAGRKIPIEMHAKGSDQKIIDIALATGMPVTLAPKYWAEHMGLPYAQTAIRTLELPKADRTDKGFFAQSNGSRSFTRYGYADLLTEDRKIHVVHRMWPGTQRMLLWGDPVFAAAYGRTSSFCGSDGAELFEPMSFKGRMGSGLAGGRQGYEDESLKTKDDWEKYRYGYVLWGRMLYNPQTQPEVWRRVLRSDFGKAAPAVEAALGSASRILPLVTTAHAQSASYTAWWVELSYNMPIVNPARKHPFADTPSPKRFGNVSPLDPQLFARISDFADLLIKGERSAKYTPAEAASWLEGLARDATVQLAAATKAAGTDDRTPAFRRMAVDVFIVAQMGLFFAQKLRAGILWELHEKTGDEVAGAEALMQYKAARQAWADLADRATGVYRAEITYGPGYFQHGHWKDRLPAIDGDLADMETRLKEKQPAASAAVGSDKVAVMIEVVLKPAKRADFKVEHVAPGSFERGKAIAISLSLGAAGGKAPAPRLYFRHVDQAETFQSTEMTAGEKGEYRAIIPAEYTQSPFAMQYYFELRDAEAKAGLYPGLKSEWNNQPYFVIRQMRATAAKV